MTHQHPVCAAEGDQDVGGRLAQLTQLQTLVAQIAGRALRSVDNAALEHGARARTAYDHALPVVRKRFDALLAETATWAAVGVEALLKGEGQPPRAAAAQLGAELARARTQLDATLARHVAG